MFQWNDYLQLAKESEQQSGKSQIEEAYLRSAISRAYYAAYHKAREYAINNGYPNPGRRGAHKEICEFLQGQRTPKITDQSIIRIGEQLDRCRQARGMSDYENGLLNFNFVFECSKVIQWSEFIIQNLP